MNYEKMWKKFKEELEDSHAMAMMFMGDKPDPYAKGLLQSQKNTIAQMKYMEELERSGK